MNKIIFIISFTFLLGCNSDQALTTDFFDDETYMSGNNVFMTIYAQFDECGEWGGHEETIEILHKMDSGFYFNYQKSSVDCDSMVNIWHLGAFYPGPYKKLEIEKQSKLSVFGKAAINQFTHDLIDEKFKITFPGHAGILLSLTTSDSSLIINTYGGDAKSFIELKSKLGVE